MMYSNVNVTRDFTVLEPGDLVVTGDDNIYLVIKIIQPLTSGKLFQLIDDSGQTHQFGILLNGKSLWKKVIF